MMLAFGSLLAHLLSKVVPWLAGLCVLNVVILVTHFIAIGFFHPETPRFLFAVKDRKADCANSFCLSQSWFARRATFNHRKLVACSPGFISESMTRMLFHEGQHGQGYQNDR